MSEKKTAIVTGAQGGIGGGLVEGFLKQGYNVVATSLHVSQPLTATPGLVFVDGEIGKQETAAKTVEAAIKAFGSIDVLVNSAGIFRTAAGPKMRWRRSNRPYSHDCPRAAVRPA